MDCLINLWEVMKMKKTIYILAALMFLWVPLASANLVNNPSFELPVQTIGGSNTTVTDWSGGSNKGVWYPNPDETYTWNGSVMYIAPPEGGGNQVGYASNSSLLQWRNDLQFEAGYTYALSVYVGTWVGPSAGYGVYLMYASPSAVNLAWETGTVYESEQMTKLVTLLYKVNPGDNSIGKNIGIALDATGINEVDFDMVTLTKTPVPIPPSVWLLSSGLVGLLGIRRRFKK
jgi:hypothetical protein